MYGAYPCCSPCRQIALYHGIDESSIHETQQLIASVIGLAILAWLHIKLLTPCGSQLGPTLGVFGTSMAGCTCSHPRLFVNVAFGPVSPMFIFSPGGTSSRTACTAGWEPTGSESLPTGSVGPTSGSVSVDGIESLSAETHTVIDALIDLSLRPRRQASVRLTAA